MEYVNDTEIGRRIKDLRESQNITQGQLGDALGGLDQGAVSRLESGHRSLSATEIVKASQILNVTPVTLVADQGSGAIMLRADESADAEIAECVDVFQTCVDDYFGLRALAG